MPQAPGPTRPMPTVEEDGSTGRVLADDDPFFDEPLDEEPMAAETLPPGVEAVGMEATSFAPVDDLDFVADGTVPERGVLQMRQALAQVVQEDAPTMAILDLLSRCTTMFRRFEPSARERLAKLIHENPEAGMVEIEPMEVLIRCEQDTASAEPVRGHGMYIFDLGGSGKITLHALNPREDGGGLLALTFVKYDVEVVGEAACFDLPITSTVKYMGRDTVYMGRDIVRALFLPASLIRALPPNAQAELLARGLEQRSFLSDLNTDMAMMSATTETEPYTIPAHSHPREVLNWLLEVGAEGREVRTYRSREEIELILGTVAYLKKGCVNVVENQTDGLGDNVVVAKVMEGNLLGERIAVAKPGETGIEATAKLIANTDCEIVYIPIPRSKKSGDPHYKAALRARIAALRALHISMAAKLQRAAAHRNALALRAARPVERRN